MNDTTNAPLGECRNCGLLLEVGCITQTGTEGVFCSSVCLNEIKDGKVPRQHRPESVGALVRGSR